MKIQNRKSLFLMLFLMMLTLAACSGGEEVEVVELVQPTPPAETETIAPPVVQEEVEAGYENESGGGAGPNAVGGDDTQGANDSQASIGFPMVVHLFNLWCGDNVALGDVYCAPWPTIETLEAFCAADGAKTLSELGFVSFFTGVGEEVLLCSDYHLGFVREDIRLKLEAFDAQPKD